MATVTSTTSGTDMTFMSFDFFMSTARNGDPESNGTTGFNILDDNSALNFAGNGFGGFDKQGFPTVGTITYVSFNAPGGHTLSIQGLNIPVATFRDIVTRNDVAGLQTLVLGGSDTISGEDAVGDVLLGYGGADRLDARGGNDTLRGGDGADTLIGGEGNDLIDGGSGVNWASFTSGGFDRTNSGVNVSLLKQGAAQATGRGDDTLLNIQNLEGSLYADTLTGDAANNIFNGAGGNDSISGLGGDDYVFVTAGAQTIDGGVGTDFLFFNSATTFSLALQGRAQAVGAGTVVATNIEGLSGSAFNDSLTGDAGGNLILPGGGNDTVSGGAGDDYITESSGSNYLRGDEGDDRITGGTGFDDINGNMGNDTAAGGLGDDWVVGGKDNDSLSGDAGGDLVYGNIGNDTCDGGDGNDIVRGGQDDDIVTGGAGDDYVSGDRGSDTMTGGAGADIFHTFGDAGLDRVTDFNRAEGDRVQVDPGTVYKASQVGADTVIDMTGGGKMILVGVSMASLTGDWIFGA